MRAAAWKKNTLHCEIGVEALRDILVPLLPPLKVMGELKYTTHTYPNQPQLQAAQYYGLCIRSMLKYCEIFILF